MIQRKPLRDSVQREILDRIGDRRLPAGTRINESHLSAEIGVSRTPLREAMLGLEALGFLAADMGRGFLVPPLSAVEFRDLQTLLARLAPLALELAPATPPDRVMELQNLLGRARAHTDPHQLEREEFLGGLARRWSALLVDACSNPVLTGDIARLETLSVRYWREAVRGGLDARPLIMSYEQMYEMLRTGRRDEAGRAWASHIANFAPAAARHLPRATAEA